MNTTWTPAGAPDAKHTFWCVWSPRGHSPSKRHPLKVLAQAEANRLSQRFQGRHFYVLEMVGYVITGAPTLTANQAKKAAEAAGDRPIGMTFNTARVLTPAEAAQAERDDRVDTVREAMGLRPDGTPIPIISE